MALEWNDNQPIYRQLRDRVVAMILDGVLKEGDPLPSVRVVAAEYRVNPLTVLKGYQQLVDEKLVEKPGGGWVCSSMQVPGNYCSRASARNFWRRNGRESPRPFNGLASRPKSCWTRRSPILQRKTMLQRKETKNMTIVEARGLRKTFGTNIALNGVDFHIKEGRIVGLIGPNGAGKSTALNAILGLTSFEGQLKVLGRDPWTERDALMRDVCFIADVAVLPRWTRVWQVLEYMAGVHPRFDRAKAEGFLAKTSIQRTSKVRELSKGMVTQLHLALVMAIDARLLVLDEPTFGLDILYRKQFYDSLLNDYYDRTRTHYRDDAPGGRSAARADGLDVYRPWTNCTELHHGRNREPLRGSRCESGKLGRGTSVAADLRTAGSGAHRFSVRTGRSRAVGGVGRSANTEHRRLVRGGDESSRRCGGWQRERSEAMNPQSDALSESSEAQHVTPMSAANTRPMYWSVRRELWEYRSIYIAPLAAGGLFLLGFLISLIHLPTRMKRTGVTRSGTTAQSDRAAIRHGGGADHDYDADSWDFVLPGCAARRAAGPEHIVLEIAAGIGCDDGAVEGEYTVCGAAVGYVWGDGGGAVRDAGTEQRGVGWKRAECGGAVDAIVVWANVGAAVVSPGDRTCVVARAVLWMAAADFCVGAAHAVSVGGVAGGGDCRGGENRVQHHAFCEPVVAPVGWRGGSSYRAGEHADESDDTSDAGKIFECAGVVDWVGGDGVVFGCGGAVAAVSGADVLG